MRTRSGLCYPQPFPAASPTTTKRGFDDDGGEARKRARSMDQSINSFDGLPDDLVLLILSKLSASASSPSNLISALLTCRIFSQLAMHRKVLSVLSVKGTVVRAKNWTKSTHGFLESCAEAGNIEASYTLGMICFYCLQIRELGKSLITIATNAFHPEALRSLSIIKANGSGESNNDKDLCACIKLCLSAANHGHIDAIRELGLCFKDGYGVPKNIDVGLWFIIQANLRELELALARKARVPVNFCSCHLYSDFGCNVPPPEAHPATRFMVEWFAARGAPSADGEGGEGLSMCSYGGCGRPETRHNEFRRCTVCEAVMYCSRACQGMHWKMGHKDECASKIGNR